MSNWSQIVPKLLEFVGRNWIMGLVMIDQEKVPASKQVSFGFKVVRGTGGRDMEHAYLGERELFGLFFFAGAALVVAVVAAVPKGQFKARSLAVTVVGTSDTWRSELRMKGEWQCK